MKIILSLVLALLLAGLSHAVEVPLDAKESSLKFTGHAFLHDFDGEAKQFSGTAQIDPQKPELVLGAKIIIQAAKMTTFVNARDRNMVDWLHADANPEITFQLTKVKLLKGDLASATKDHAAQFSVQGDFTLNKTTKPLITQVDAWRESKSLIVTGATKIDTTQYGLPIVRQLFLTVDKQVDITFRLVFNLPPAL